LIEEEKYIFSFVKTLFFESEKLNFLTLEKNKIT